MLYIIQSKYQINKIQSYCVNFESQFVSKSYTWSQWEIQVQMESKPSLVSAFSFLLFTVILYGFTPNTSAEGQRLASLLIYR